MHAEIIMGKLGTFQNDAKVVNSLFGETWRIAGFEQTNCQLGFERCRKLYTLQSSQERYLKPFSELPH